MKRLWIILAGVSAIVAVILVLRQNYEKAFVSAVVGAVAWFLSYRVQMQEVVKTNQSQESDDDWENDEDE